MNSTFQAIPRRRKPALRESRPFVPANKFAFYLFVLAHKLRAMRRELLKDITRIVVKLGTGVLTDRRKQPDLAQMEQLVSQLAAQRQAGREIILVTSGAVGAGMGALGFDRRPAEGPLRKTLRRLPASRRAGPADSRRPRTSRTPSQRAQCARHPAQPERHS